jgi:hypothetical protein
LPGNSEILKRNVTLVVVIAAMILGAVAFLAMRHSGAGAPAPAVQPAGPVTAVYDGHVYNCQQVAQLVSQGEWYTPDGYHIPAVMLADCNI